MRTRSYYALFLIMVFACVVSSLVTTKMAWLFSSPPSTNHKHSHSEPIPSLTLQSTTTSYRILPQQQQQQSSGISTLYQGVQTTSPIATTTTPLNKRTNKRPHHPSRDNRAEKAPKAPFLLPRLPPLKKETDAVTTTQAFVTWPLPQFDLAKSTQENYQHVPDQQQGSLSSVTSILEQSLYASIRRELDYSYHSVYNLERQAFQDELIQTSLHPPQQVQHKPLDVAASCFIKAEETTKVEQQQPWIVFTAGVMGAGKTHALEWLRQKNLFPLQNFVSVDPDELRRQLPEFDYYCQHGAAVHAGERTRKEAGLLTEILTTAALQSGKSVVVDGTLRDADWYQDYFDKLRQAHPNHRIAILHITAPAQAVLQRAKNRAKTTGRIVPETLLKKVMQQVPASVQILKEKVDLFVELHNGNDPNSNDIRLVSPPGLSWNEFAHLWNCPSAIEK